MFQPTTAERTISNLTDCFGNGRTNEPRDVMWVKEALRLLGRYDHEDEPHPFIDRRLHDAVMNYQSNRGLRRDGYLKPGGETETTLGVELARLLGRARR